MRNLLTSALTLAALASPLRAQTAPPPGPAPTPCVNSPERHQFDFWIGDWKVSPSQRPTFEAGTSKVESIAGGCALLENWSSFNGGHGKSINAFDVATKQWQQYWIGQDGNVTFYRESEWKGKTIVYLARDHSPWQRLSFTPLDDGSVQQLGEISPDSGKTWKTGYDFRYRHP
jgi:hypothetical protein